MSNCNWLGFSLSSIEDGFGGGGGGGGGEEDQGGSNGGDNGSFSSHNHHEHISIMPLRSDGSLCIVDDPFVRYSGWTSTTTEGDEAGPKLEDFLGSYSNSTDQSNGVYDYQNQQQTYNGNGCRQTSTFMSTTTNGDHQQQGELDANLTNQYLNYNFQQQYNLNSYLLV